MNFSGAQLPVTRERTGHSCVSRSFRKASYKHKTKENISIFLITILLMEMKRHFIFFLKKRKNGTDHHVSGKNVAYVGHLVSLSCRLCQGNTRRIVVAFRIRYSSRNAYSRVLFMRLLIDDIQRLIDFNAVDPLLLCQAQKQ